MTSTTHDTNCKSETQHPVQPVVRNAAVGCNVWIYRSNWEHHIPAAVDGVFRAEFGKTWCPIAPGHRTHHPWYTLEVQISF